MPGLTNPLALFGLLLLLPVILLYLLKPKPKDVKLPSVMFIKQVEKTKLFTALFRKLVRDPLLVTQLLVISLLVFSIVNPYFMSNELRSEKKAVAIVIDSSASMKALSSGSSRFDKAREIAYEILGGMNEGEDEVTLILASSTPMVVHRKSVLDVGVLDVLDKVQCSDTPSNLGSAILLAKDVLSTELELDREIYVLSDFTGEDAVSPSLARKIASLNDMKVSFIQVGGKGSVNYGITSLSGGRSIKQLNKLNLAFEVHSYSPDDEDVGVTVKVDGKVVDSGSRVIPSYGSEFYYVESAIPLTEQLVSIELDAPNDLNVDDKVYMILPEVRDYHIMLISSSESDKYLRLALESPASNNVYAATPPVIPEASKYDTVVLGEVDLSSMLPGTFREMREYVQSGGSFIVVGSDCLLNAYGSDPDLREILPVGLVKLESTSGRSVNIESSHDIVRDVSFKDTVAIRYYTVEERNGSTVVAETGGNPLIALWRYGDGVVAYVGLGVNSRWSNFYYSSSFPIFWSQLVKYVNEEVDSIGLRNYRTGESLPFSREITVASPSGNSLSTSNLFLDEAGVYKVSIKDGSSRVVANLLSELESNITLSDSFDDCVDGAEFNPSGDRVEVKRDLYTVLLAIALIILLIEVHVYRGRGLLWTS